MGGGFRSYRPGSALLGHVAHQEGINVIVAFKWHIIYHYVSDKVQVPNMLSLCVCVECVFVDCLYVYIYIYIYIYMRILGPT
jgi:hypothetical protein